MEGFLAKTFARVLWCLLVSGLFWIVAWITNPSINSGDVWIIGFAVGLIIFEMPNSETKP